jgi:hypothetical protein
LELGAGTGSAGASRKQRRDEELREEREGADNRRRFETREGFLGSYYSDSHARQGQNITPREMNSPV